MPRYWQLADPMWLEREYRGRGLDMKSIAARLGCNLTSVHSALRRHGIPARRRGGPHRLRHGLGNSPTAKSWWEMRSRCNDSKRPDYRWYGARGVSVCARWDPAKGGSFDNFLADLGERPPGTTLGRLGDTGNYEPGNVAWQTQAEQTATQVAKRRAGKAA